MIHDLLENWNFYFSGQHWKCVFEKLSLLSSESRESEYLPIQGDDIYAAVMSYRTCAPREAKLETHDQYIDVQISLVNSEAIDWFPRRILKEEIPYDPERDRTFYHYPGVPPVHINNYPGYFTVLFPKDAHMPKLMTAEKPEMVKKAVIKVRKDHVI